MYQIRPSGAKANEVGQQVGLAARHFTMRERPTAAGAAGATGTPALRAFWAGLAVSGLAPAGPLRPSAVNTATASPKPIPRFIVPPSVRLLFLRRWFQLRPKVSGP